VTHLESAEILRHLQVQCIRVNRPSLLLPGADCFDKHVFVGELFGNGEADLLSVRRQAFQHGDVGPDKTEPAAVLADEGVAAEQEFQIHLVKVQPDPFEIPEGEIDPLAFGFQFESRLRSRQRILLLLAVLVVGHLRASAFDLFHLLRDL